MSQNRITDDLDALLGVLPKPIVDAVHKANDYDRLLEIILDLGRFPTARYVQGEIVLRDKEITREELDHVVERIGDFDADNRAGIERTLHRISAIRNRRGHIVGLTLRVGRAVYGTIEIIQDIIESGKSILILGRPGVGKTTLLREAARILAESRRVIIVDTSNEIGGDGDVPHPAVGKARRMQVKVPTLQHEVMNEAVENLKPRLPAPSLSAASNSLAQRTAKRSKIYCSTPRSQTWLAASKRSRSQTRKPAAVARRRPFSSVAPLRPLTYWSRSKPATNSPSTLILPKPWIRFCAGIPNCQKCVPGKAMGRSKSKNLHRHRWRIHAPGRIPQRATRHLLPLTKRG
jgi:energy-coupling factor transporter ATP-binding protein EcfA2